MDFQFYIIIQSVLPTTRHLCKLVCDFAIFFVLMFMQFLDLCTPIFGVCRCWICYFTLFYKITYWVTIKYFYRVIMPNMEQVSTTEFSFHINQQVPYEFFMNCKCCISFQNLTHSFRRTDWLRNFSVAIKKGRLIILNFRPMDLIFRPIFNKISSIIDTKIQGLVVIFFT